MSFREVAFAPLQGDDDLDEIERELRELQRRIALLETQVRACKGKLGVPA